MDNIFNYRSIRGIWKFFIILIFTLKNLYVVGQVMAVSTGKLLETDLFFERFYSKNGLPDDRIRTIFQDHKGFLWIGTMNGVSRYDGYTFKNYYKTRLPNSISGNWAYAICEDSENNIWIGTREGLNKFDKEKSSFKSFVNDKNNINSISSNVINGLQFDKKGLLWIGTPQGLNRFNPTNNTFKRFNTYPFNTNVYSIIPSNGDFIWIATRDGVVHYNTKTNKYRFFKILVKSNPYGDKFWSMLEDHNDLYLTTGGDGLVKLPYNSKTNSYNSFQFVNDFKGGSINSTEVFSICKSLNGDFWIGTTGLGLAKIENINSPNKKITFYKNNALNNQSISNNQVYKLFIDRSNVLWCGTDEGLNKLDLYLLPFQYYTFTDKSKKDQVRSLYSKDGKTVWLGTTKSGIIQHNIISGEGKSVNFNNRSINSNRSLLIDGNDIWNGTLEGVIKLNQSLTEYKKPIEGHAVFTLIKDSKGNIWAGTNNGVYKIKPDGSRINYLSNKSRSNSNMPSFVRSLYEDNKGNIWIGSENGPLVYYNPKRDRFITLSSVKSGVSLFNSIIFSITESPKNVIWVGSESGLNKITSDNNKYIVKSFTEESGLPDKSVRSILPDSNGNLWLGTIKGLAKFNIKTESFQYYLHNISFNSNSSLKVNEHCFLFGSYEGYVLFDPYTVSSDSMAPEVVISDLKLSNKSVNIGEEINGDVILNEDICYTKEITLHYDNQFTIEFTGLHFSNPENNIYKYKLDGFTDNWTYANAKNRSATYTNLDSGTYTFIVKSSNYSGKWNGKSQKLIITILPPLWKTWWAFMLYFIIFTLLFYVFLKYLLIQSKQRNQIRFEQQEKEQLKNLNQMKVRFFTDISHEFRTPLSLIVGPTEDLMNSDETTESVKNKVKLIYRNCTKLLYLLDELMTFQKMEQGMLKLNSVNGDIIVFIKDIYENFKTLADKNGVEFNLVTDIQFLYTDFDPQKMEMVMNNLLFNAFKFLKKTGGLINIRITQLKLQDFPDKLDSTIPNWICIAIEDNGKGLSAEEFKNLFQRFFSESTVKGASGVGLSLTKNLVELHKGSITAESNPDIKTVFKVYLPIQSLVDQNFENYKYVAEFDVSIMADKPNTNVFDKDESDKDQFSIMVVDDNPEILDYLEMIFSDGYEVVKAENGMEALIYIKDNLPDLIISDVMMPEMDGVELCKAVKTDINTCHIPFILLSAKSAIEDRIVGLQIGADDYIPKPFHPNVLKAKVENLIKAQKRIVEKFYADGAVLIPKNITQNPLNEKFLNKVIESIKANMSNEEFSVEELGSIVAMSRSNLFRKLKAITGQTPIEFIYYIRLRYAMELLLERKMSISEIAYEVGFKNPSSFTKSFKKHFGKSPSDYLNSLLNS